MKDKTIYISGQITGMDLLESEQLFRIAQDKLELQGYKVINPWYILPYHPEHKWEDYMKKDIDVIFNEVDEMYMLPNWVNSKGAIIEHQIAINLKIPITYEQA